MAWRNKKNSQRLKEQTNRITLYPISSNLLKFSLRLVRQDDRPLQIPILVPIHPKEKKMLTQFFSKLYRIIGGQRTILQLKLVKKNNGMILADHVNRVTGRWISGSKTISRVTYTCRKN
jgi:hypothetical protein